MDADQQTVFLSGTRRDLKPFFLAAQKAIEERLPSYRVVTMDDVTPEDVTSAVWSQRGAATQHVLIGLVGRYYGTVRGDGPSYTEQEFDAAGRAGVERLMFLTEAGEPAIIANQDEASRRRLEAFRTRIKASVVHTQVSTPEEFADKAVLAIKAWERRTLYGALMSAEQFIRFCEPSTPEGLMSHSHTYIGAGEARNVVEQFLGSSQRILVLHGAWGRGKTRALLESCGRKLPMELRFLREGVTLDLERLKKLAGERYALVVENVHRLSSPEQRALLLFLKQHAPEVKLIVTARTNQLQAFEAQLREQNFQRSELQLYEVPLLTEQEQRQLIQAILGREDKELAYHLARRTRGNALATVLVARRALRGADNLREIEGEDFEYAIVEGFFDLLVKEAGESEERRQHFEDVMKLLAVVGPVHPNNTEELDALTRFLAIPTHRLLQSFDMLERAGLLSRHGGLVRVPVDAVAEQLVVRAAVTSRGESTRYIEQVMDELASPFLGSILRNLAAADWDPERPGRVSSVTGGIWHILPELYERLPFRQKERMLEAVADIAPLTPAAALRFAKWLLEQARRPQEQEEPARSLLERTVHSQVTELLGNVLGEPSCVATACDLLWEWAAPESPDANARPDSAERILSEAGEYRWTKSRSAYEAFVTWADSRSHGPRRIATPRLAKYLRPLLRHELEHRWFDGVTMTMAAMGLPYSQVAALRTRVIDLLIRLAAEGGMVDTQQALAALGEALGEPLGMFNRNVTDEERAAWAPEQEYILERLRRLSEERQSKVVDLCIQQQIDWLAEHGSVPSVRDRARKFFDALQRSLAGTLEQALSAKMELDEDLKDANRRIAELHRDAALQLIALPLPPQEALEKLTRSFVELTEAEMRPSVLRVLYEAAHASPEHGRAWGRVLLTQPGHALRPYLHNLARGLLRSDPEAGKALLQSLIEDGSADLLREFTLWGLGAPVFDAKTLLDYQRRLMHHPHAGVREQAFVRLRDLHEVPVEERAQLLLDYPLADFLDSADQWAETVEHQSPFYELYGQKEREFLTLQLRLPWELKYWGLRLLERLARDVPSAVVDTLLARVLNSSKERLEGEFSRSTERGKPLLAGLPAAERERVMLALAELFDHENSRTASQARSWFRILCRGHSNLLRKIRRRWIESGTPADLDRALDTFDSARRHELFKHEADVVALLRAFAQLGPQELDEAKHTLARVARHGFRTGTPGKPFPLDLFIRDQARKRAGKYPPGSLEATFYRDLADAQDREIQRHLEREAEDLA
ncbi:MAG TPA: DUF4062 domain-containing protein [Myxococcaceae bacterium]|jgi:hypothetical protein